MGSNKTRSMTVLMVIALLSTSLIWSSTAQQQTCDSYTFAGNVESFNDCSDLPVLNSFIHWTYAQSTGTLRMAYRHTGVATGTWVAWGINPSILSMAGVQALVAIPQTTGTPRVFTSPVANKQITTLTEGSLSYAVTDLSATYLNSEVVIFATWTLPANTSTINQLWQAGPMSGTSPRSHSTSSNENMISLATLDLLSGQSQTNVGGNSRIRNRNIHGVLNAVSWGILLPTGAIVARYLKVFKSADPAWFYLHVTCQTVGYIVGVAGWATGLKLGSDSPGITHNPHRPIGIAIFCLGTLQVFALLLRPKKDHKYRFYWNIYHHMTGYAVIALSIANIYEGFEILNPENVWKRSYTGVIIALAAMAVLLEAYTWFYVLKIKKSETKSSFSINGANGVNGYSARTHGEA